MKIFRFNTNIENTENLQELSKVFNRDRRIISFKVATQEPLHVMEVSCNEDISEQEVRDLVTEAGFQSSDVHASVPGNAQ